MDTKSVPTEFYSTLCKTYRTLYISVRQPITEVQAECNAAADVREIEREVVILRNTATEGNLIRDNVLSIDSMLISEVNSVSGVGGGVFGLLMCCQYHEQLTNILEEVTYNYYFNKMKTWWIYSRCTNTATMPEVGLVTCLLLLCIFHHTQSGYTWLHVHGMHVLCS